MGVAVAVFVAASVAAPDPYSHLHHDRLKRTRYVAWQLECCQQGILSKKKTRTLTNGQAPYSMGYCENDHCEKLEEGKNI